MAQYGRLLLVLLGLLYTSALFAESRALPIGYLEWADDSRYDEDLLRLRLPYMPWGRPYEAAVMALEENRFAFSLVAAKPRLERRTVADAASLKKALAEFVAAGVLWVLIDFPDAAMPLLRSTGAYQQPLLLFNLSAGADRWREKDCAATLFHIIPSNRMRMDAMAQFLVARKWRRVLVLEGEQQSDAAWADGFVAAMRRFGLKLVARKMFTANRDPRKRYQNNVALLTSGLNYDLLFVADTQGELARSAIYKGQLPRPLVGGAGLMALAWHWGFERYGAPQLNNRFWRHAGRRMSDYDWASWAAIKTLAESLVRTQSWEPNILRRYLRGTELVVDGFKGSGMSFRPWNQQLRQPLLLASYDWVVERAPLTGFLHPSEELDSVGIDRPDSRCRLAD